MLEIVKQLIEEFGVQASTDFSKGLRLRIGSLVWKNWPRQGGNNLFAAAIIAKVMQQNEITSDMLSLASEIIWQKTSP